MEVGCAASILQWVAPHWLSRGMCTRVARPACEAKAACAMGTPWASAGWLVQVHAELLVVQAQTRCDVSCIAAAAAMCSVRIVTNRTGVALRLLFARTILACLCCVPPSACDKDALSLQLAVLMAGVLGSAHCRLCRRKLFCPKINGCPGLLGIFSVQKQPRLKWQRCHIAWRKNHLSCTCASSVCLLLLQPQWDAVERAWQLCQCPCL